MKKSYSRRYICEAIRYWKAKLRRLNEFQQRTTPVSYGDVEDPDNMEMDIDGSPSWEKRSGRTAELDDMGTSGDWSLDHTVAPTIRYVSAKRFQTIVDEKYLKTLKTLIDGQNLFTKTQKDAIMSLAAGYKGKKFDCPSDVVSFYVNKVESGEF